jgi:hypothetical protein
MKKNIFTIVLLLIISNMSINAQNSWQLSDEDRIAVLPYVSDQVEYLPAAAKNNLQSKLAQIVSANGYGSSAGSFPYRFIITPNISVVDKYVVSGAPPRISLNLNVALFVGDGVTGTKYASTAVNVKGVGRSETKAYLSALQRINSNNSAIKGLLRDAKQKIIAFYSNQCDFILKEADALAKQNRFDEALFQLNTIPRVSTDCFNKALDKATPIFKQKIDRDCNLLLNKAKNAWNGGLDFEAAQRAAEFLGQIEPSSSCFNDVERFYNTIQKRLKKVDGREWNFILQRQQDYTKIAVQSLKNYREVALANAQNQPQAVTYNVRGWW